MPKSSYHEGWGYTDTIKLTAKGTTTNRNNFFKEFKKNYPKDQVEKSGKEYVEVYVYESQIPLVKRMAKIFDLKITYGEGGGTGGQEIARTILAQLGGQGKLVVMTGAYNFIALKNGVSFKLKSRKANFIKIILNSKDLYDLEFIKLIGLRPKKIAQYNDIYFDQLIPIVEKETGMYLKLFKKGGFVSTQNRDMVLSQLKAIHHHEKELKSALKTSPEIEAWILAKVQRATVDLSDVTHYLDGKTEYANGGVTDSLLKELHRLQKDLNSSRLSTYLQGDTSKEEEARQRERQSKVNRFNEVLKLLNGSDKKFSNGGGLSIADANPYIAGAKAVQGIAPSSFSALDQRIARKLNPDPNRPVFFKKGGSVDGGITDDLELLKSKIRNISKKMEYDGESGYGGYVIYLDEDKIKINTYTNLLPYSAQATDEVKVSFNTLNKTMIIFSTNVFERFEDNNSFEKYGGIKYIYEPLTNKIASEILEKIKEFTFERDNKFKDGGEIYSHKHSRNWGEDIKIELIEETKKGWKVKQTTIKGRNNKSKVAYFTMSEIAELFEKI